MERKRAQYSLDDLRTARAHIDTARAIVTTIAADFEGDGLALVADDLFRARDTLTQLLGIDDTWPTCAVCDAAIPISVIQAAASRGKTATYCSPRHRSTATKRRQRKATS